MQTSTRTTSSILSLAIFHDNITSVSPISIGLLHLVDILNRGRTTMIFGTAVLTVLTLNLTLTPERLTVIWHRRRTSVPNIMTIRLVGSVEIATSTWATNQNKPTNQPTNQQTRVITIHTGGVNNNIYNNNYCGYEPDCLVKLLEES